MIDYHLNENFLYYVTFSGYSEGEYSTREFKLTIENGLINEKESAAYKNENTLVAGQS